MEEYVAAVDFGTTKVLIMLGHINKYGEFEVAAMENVPYDRLFAWDDIDGTKPYISRAIDSINGETNHRIHHIMLGIPGYYCGLIKNEAEISVKRSIITSEEIALVLKSASTYPLPDEWRVYKTIPNYYHIDNGPETNKVLNKSGNQLKTCASLICIKQSFVDQIGSLLSDFDIEIDSIRPTLMACGEALLTREEKKNGSILIDIGGKSTDIIVYKSGVPVHIDWLPVGGYNITNDLALGLDIPFEQADKLKRQCILGLDLSRGLKDANMDIPVKVGDKVQKISMLDAQEIVESRTQEIFELIRNSVESSNAVMIDECTAVLTGGGVALIRGAKDFGAHIIGCPLRLAQPEILGVPNTASLSSVYCLLQEYFESTYDHTPKDVSKDSHSFNWIDKIIQWLKDYF